MPVHSSQSASSGAGPDAGYALSFVAAAFRSTVPGTVLGAACPAVGSVARDVRRAMAFCLCLLLFGGAFPANGRAEQPEKEISARELVRQITPSDEKLSPEAEHLYYYLLLSQGLYDNSQLVVAYALKGLLKLDPSLPVYQDSATILLARGEYGAAESTAADGLRHYPDDTLLTLLLAGAYSESGQIPRAVSLLEAHLKIRPDAREATEELVRLYLKEGQDKKASDMLVRLPPTDLSPEAELFRAGVLSTVGRNTEARELLRSLLEKQPALFEAWLELAYIAEREKNMEEAVTAYGKAAEITPDNPEIWFRIAVLQLALNNPDEAMRAVDSAPPSASLYMQAALRFADAGQYERAKTLLEQSRKNGGGADEIALIQSMILQESAGDPKAGLPPLDAIAPDSPLYATVLQQKARIYLQAREYVKAHAAALDGRKRFPEQKELWGLEAYALVKMKKTGDAETLLKQSLEQYPGDEELLFSLGGIQDEIGKKDEAMKTMELIITINPKNYQALNYVGYTLAENNTELKRALTLITAALEQNPDADYIVDSLAWAQYRLGRHEEAWKNINRCISMGADEATIWEHYGDIALALGKREEAAKGYAEAILRKPDNIDVVRKKLTDLNK